jgi:serine/threonine protein kinase
MNGQEIAVKRLSGNSHQGLEQLKNEVKLLAYLQQKNLVRLFGCCLDGIEKLLVYEYFSNTSLDNFLFGMVYITC